MMILNDETYGKYNYCIEDFSKYSAKTIILKCDYCNDVFERKISSITISRKNSTKDSCGKKECKGKKISETKGIISDIPKGHRKCSNCGELKVLNSDFYNKDGKNRFKYKCKICSAKIYHINKVLVTDTIIPLEEAIVVYEEVLLEDNNLLPYNFFERIDNINGFFDYIFKIKTETYKERFKNFNIAFISAYRLNSLLVKHKSIYGIINHIYPDYIKPWELVKSPQGYWNSDINKKLALEWFVEQLILDNLILDLGDLPKVVNFKLLEKYGLGGLVCHQFNSSPYEAINFLFPNMFKSWSFTTSRNFYNNIENRRLITKEFIKTLINDNYIGNEEEIPFKVNIHTFKKYNLYKFLITAYGGVSFKAFEELFPGRWKVWEFKSCPTGYWESEDNIKDAIYWFTAKLTELGLIENIEDIIDLPLHRLLKEYNLATLTKDSVKMMNYFIKVFPDKLSLDMFKQNIANDGTICLSKPEVIIHNLLLKNNVDFKYGSKTIRFKNSAENESYVPDWLVQNNIIIEYFGLYTSNQTSSILINYRNKTHRKEKYYNQLDAYKFISIYPYDMKDGMKGLIAKFLTHGIKLKLKAL